MIPVDCPHEFFKEPYAGTAVIEECSLCGLRRLCPLPVRPPRLRLIDRAREEGKELLRDVGIMLPMLAICCFIACGKPRTVLVPVPCPVDVPAADLKCAVPPGQAHAGEHAECVVIGWLRLKDEVRMLREAIEACNKPAPPEKKKAP